MALTREQALWIRDLLDNWLPPVLRDSKLLMYPLMFLVFGRRFRVFADFRRRGFQMSPVEFTLAYETTADLQKLQGETDLNESCTAAILSNLVGNSALDVGCGRGYLVKRMRTRLPRVTGCDIVLDSDLVDSDGVTFRVGTAERLPFKDDSFDTVVCTHTLEHVQRLQDALAELRRVTARRLIVVVPRERPYRYSFNLHLHFFPYAWSWEAVAGSGPNSRLKDLKDWFWIEDQTVTAGSGGEEFSA